MLSLAGLLASCSGGSVADRGRAGPVCDGSGPRGESLGPGSTAHERSVIGPSGRIGNTLCLNADIPGGENIYRRIERVFGKGAVEAPSDTVYNPARAHVLTRTDDVVGAYLAILAIEPTDVNLDGVPLAQGGDRSRSEIKLAPGNDGVHEAFKAHAGDTFTYTWRFRIAAGMKFAPSFTHIHQIKAYDGAYAEPPLITFTALGDGRLQVRYVGDGEKTSAAYAVLDSMPLAGVAGQWIDVREEIVYSNPGGRYRLSIRDQHGAELLRIDKGDLQLWRSGADHMRPKWGIYRKHHAALNQHVEDVIDFANIGITRGVLPDSNCR
jgi:hypothetical protein